jgi:hypothetical protein
VDIRPLIDVEHFHHHGLLVYAVDDSISPAAYAMAARKRAKERPADLTRAQRQRRVTEFDHLGRGSRGQPLSDGPGKFAAHGRYIHSALATAQRGKAP